MTHDDDLLDFNFWPSVADMMLALVLILLLVLAMIGVATGKGKGKGRGSLDISPTRLSQDAMVNAIAASMRYVVSLDDSNPDKGLATKSLRSSGSTATEVKVWHEPKTMRIAFQDKVLFKRGEHSLTDRGRDILRSVGRTLSSQLQAVREAQIQGHADTVPVKSEHTRFSNNLELAALRAQAVYSFLQREVGIDPCRVLMSATSFGEFKPVQRLDDDPYYSRARLNLDNMTEAQCDRNRRIELLLFYRN
jgi:flagellar motor protein MotB